MAGFITTGLVSLCVVLLCGPAESSISDTLTAVLRQVQLNQLFVEENIRSDGHSGIKQTRLGNQGTRPYHSETHSSPKRTASIHDHSNHQHTVGIGELELVLNGVEFRTRHNDYFLVKPSTDSTEYHKTEDIPYPGVPTSVTSAASVTAAVEEMKEWFKAWRDQDYSVRDYRDYFKPVLCYLEGTWTTSETLEESFESDRHFLDASDWFDMHEKIRFTSFTGSKSLLENYAFLPTTVMEMVNGTTPRLAQWNYRILCHPLNNDLPLNRLRLENELTQRMANKWTEDELLTSRAARFQINQANTDTWNIEQYNYGLLDEIMSEIPGVNNYPGQLYDNAFNTQTKKYGDTSQQLNAAYYHRWYEMDLPDSMGQSKKHRGFDDENLFMAMTDHPEVASMSLDECASNPGTGCLTTQRWSYAIPLEIIYLTPLNSWNPYNIVYKGASKSTEGKTVKAGDRKGGTTYETAFNGTNSENYYHIPAEMFSPPNGTADAADTTIPLVGVLDAEGNYRETSASGVRVFFPDIPGLGELRQRYPIFPVYGHGGAAWKEIEALKDIILSPVSNAHLFVEDPTLMSSGGSDNATLIVLRTNPSSAEFGSHMHEMTLTVAQHLAAVNGSMVDVVTATVNGHSHALTLLLTPYNLETVTPGHYEMQYCDGLGYRKKCADLHGRWVKCLTA